jgi:putative transposon-encoded protein
MKKIPIKTQKTLKISNIAGFFKKIVNSYGTGAKIDCPKSYLGKEVYVVVLEDEEN